MPITNDTIATGLSDVLVGSGEEDLIAGLTGNDTITGLAGADTLIGDHLSDNLLTGVDDALSMSDFAATGEWELTSLDYGHQQITQTVETEAGGVYEISLSLAANFSGGQTAGRIEIFIDGTLVQTLDSNSGAFADHTFQFTADSSDSELLIRSTDVAGSGPVIDTSGLVYSYQTTRLIAGQEVAVSAFADGQPNLYQVLNGTLHVFDTETQTYAQVGVDGVVNVNAIGYNTQDDLIYGTAVSNGTDALGQQISNSDLVMFDATGACYRIGTSPFRSWTGDFDDQGNLWIFHSSLNRYAVIDVDNLDASGNPVATVTSLPASAYTDNNIYDLSFDADLQRFTGVARPPAEGQNATLVMVDISSGEAVISTFDVTSTRVGDTVHQGAPAITFGAAIHDGDGTLYVGGNSGDHDMNNSTGRRGGIYRVDIDADAGTASLELLTDAPGSYSNDGAADATAISPFVEVDLEAQVLIRDLSLVATTEGDLTYDDEIDGGGGNDNIRGGLGEDLGIGAGANDLLEGGDGNDSLYGGAGPDAVWNGLTSVYDADGTRRDQFGNLLPENNDTLIGGQGLDLLHGSAGHDLLQGGAGADTLMGGTGFDTLEGGVGDDDLQGGAQQDVLRGDAGDDLLDGDNGTDTLNGGDGADTLIGGSDNDTLSGDDGQDSLQGGSGADDLDGGSDADELYGGSGDDILSGGSGEDTLIAGPGDDLLQGDSGGDSLRGGTGDDDLEGGDGRDKLMGDSGNDSLSGGEGIDTLSGGNGNDTLHGGAGRDILMMGAGDDYASGGADADRFVFRDPDAGVDQILDFSIADGDTVDLRQLEIADTATWLSNNVAINEGDVTAQIGDAAVTFAGVSAQINGDLTVFWDAIVF